MPIRKRPINRKHDVKDTLDVHGLSKAGSSLTPLVQADGEKIGELRIGRGGLFWWGRKRKVGKRLNRIKIADVLDRLAYGRVMMCSGFGALRGESR